MLKIETREFKRIDKRIARRLYNAGVTIHLLPGKVMIGGGWLGNGCPITLDSSDPREFDKHVNAFEWYNCCYELGYYAAYYIRRR